MVGRPVDQLLDDLVKAAAEWGERVLDARWHLGVGGTADQPVRCEPANALAAYATAMSEHGASGGWGGHSHPTHLALSPDESLIHPTMWPI